MGSISPSLTFYTVNEERTGKCLRRVEHIRGKIFEVMTSILPKGTLGSIVSLLAVTLYQGTLW
jgi:hypothetical protein